MLRTQPTQAPALSRAYLAGGRGIVKRDLYVATVRLEEEITARERGYRSAKEMRRASMSRFEKMLAGIISEAEYNRSQK